MKNKVSGITLLSGLLLAAPGFAVTSDRIPDSHSTPKALSDVYVSQVTFVATAAQGFTRNVLLAVRVTKNRGLGMRRCDPAYQPESITIEVLDDKTKKVLAIAQRLFGSLRNGETDLFQESNTIGCKQTPKSLSLEGMKLILTDNSNPAGALIIDGFGSVTIPKKIVFKR